MKRSILIGLFALVTGMLYAQGDVNPTAPRMEHTQSFDGFLLDLGAVSNGASEAYDSIFAGFDA